MVSAARLQNRISPDGALTNTPSAVSAKSLKAASRVSEGCVSPDPLCEAFSSTTGRCRHSSPTRRATASLSRTPPSCRRPVRRVCAKRFGPLPGCAIFLMYHPRQSLSSRIRGSCVVRQLLRAGNFFYHISPPNRQEGSGTEARCRAVVSVSYSRWSSFISSHTVFFSCGLRSRYAGWKVGRTGIP